MRRITLAVMSTISGLIMLFSYHTSTNSPGGGTGTTASGATEDTTSSGTTSSGTTSSGTTSSGTTSSGTTSSGTTSSGTTSSGSSSSATYTGEEANTQWGIVEVKITVKDGKITKSEAVEYPTGNPRDQEINAYAVPQLNSEVVSAQSGSIDAVSGATVTSDGYIQSLQSAIDKANL
jgi:uncharacterized protein with FMN-binding domain